MQLQWLRYVSICRPVERHQFIIIALNRPAPCTPTPSHSILPSIVQFRFYAVVIALSSTSPSPFVRRSPSPSRSFVSNVSISDSSLFSSSHFFTSPFPHSTRYRSTSLFITHANTFTSLVTLYERNFPSLPFPSRPPIVLPSIIIPFSSSSSSSHLPPFSCFFDVVPCRSRRYRRLKGHRRKATHPPIPPTPLD